MPLLRYWDGSRWRHVGGRPMTDMYVPLSGGTITGDLLIDSSESWEAQLFTSGTVVAGVYATNGEGAFDGNIRYSASRVVDLGGTVASGASDPVASMDAVTRKYADEVTGYVPASSIPEVGDGWTARPAPYSGPRYRHGAVGRVIVLEGVLQATVVITPGASSPVLFTLPEGHRPAELASVMVIGGADAPYILNIFPDGRLQLGTGPQLRVGAYLSLDGARFVAA